MPNHKIIASIANASGYNTSAYQAATTAISETGSQFWEVPSLGHLVPSSTTLANLTPNFTIPNITTWAPSPSGMFNGFANVATDAIQYFADTSPATKAAVGAVAVIGAIAFKRHRSHQATLQELATQSAQEQAEHEEKTAYFKEFFPKLQAFTWEQFKDGLKGNGSLALAQLINLDAENFNTFKKDFFQFIQQSDNDAVATYMNLPDIEDLNDEDIIHAMNAFAETLPVAEESYESWSASNSARSSSSSSNAELSSDNGSEQDRSADRPIATTTDHPRSPSSPEHSLEKSADEQEQQESFVRSQSPSRSRSPSPRPS